MCDEVESYIKALLRQQKVHICVEGPVQCGKTTAILNALKASGRKFAHLTVVEIYGNPILSPASIVEKCITDGQIIFLDDVETLFPASNSCDFHFLNRILTKKPNIIAACRSEHDVHPFLMRYLQSFIRMEQRRSSRNEHSAPKISFDDIGGSARAKDLVLMMASWSVTNAERVKNWGLTAPSGAMLYGPPGTGKTLLAKAAANACNCSFFSVAIPDLLRCEVGESEKRLSKVFEVARADAPSIVFIDEIQALFGRRDEQKSDDNRLVVQLIAQLDINAKHGSVFCLAATNALEAVDKALLQPGRFEEVIEMGMATPTERKEIITIALKDVKHTEDVDANLDTVNDMMNGMTASEIVGLVQKAAIRALIDHRDSVSLQDLQTEIQAEIFKRSTVGNGLRISGADAAKSFAGFKF